MMNEDNKKGLVRSISGQFSRTIKFTAFTVSLVTPLMLFTQNVSAQSDCETDPDICVIGNPPPDPPDPDYEGPTPGCDYAGDSDCDDGSGGGSGGGNGSSGPSPAQCFALEQSKPVNCHREPNTSAATYNHWLNVNIGNSINPRVFEYDAQGQLVQVYQYRYLTYVVRATVTAIMSQSYMQSGTYVNSRGSIWVHLANYCQNHIPANDRNECLQEQADFLASLHPNPQQGGGSWGASIGWGGLSFSVGNQTPQGNWVSQFLNKLQEDKVCKLWYEHPHQDGCND